MKLKKICILNLFLLSYLLFTSCVRHSETVSVINKVDAEIYSDFIFIYNDVYIRLGEYLENVLIELDSAIDYYEYNSCSFEGDAKIYFYNNFDISTYLKSKTDKDRIYSITLNDDTVSTVEGISIGQTYYDMISIYGNGYSVIPGGTYRYERGSTYLALTIQEGSIISISYRILDIYG